MFGAGSPEAMQVAGDQSRRRRNADVRRLRRHRRPLRAGLGALRAANHARPDLLPDEPGGYTGFNGLFGAKYVNPLIKPGGPMTDLDGNVIQDATGHVGFPGFDGMEATVSLAWVAQMQEAGIPDHLRVHLRRA